jgi:hypothetical protein
VAIPTPRPWEKSSFYKGSRTLYKGTLCSIVTHSPFGVWSERTWLGGPLICDSVSEPNADLILAAVASHDELIAAAEMAIEEISRLGGSLDIQTWLARAVNHAKLVPTSETRTQEGV